MKINGIQIELPKLDIEKKEEVKKNNALDFGNLLESAVNKVNDFQKVADKDIENMLTGKNKNIHETMIAMEEADISLRLMVAVKNKAMDAYTTIMKMRWLED